MEKRICLMVDDDVDRQIRSYQAKLIKKNQNTCSYSKALNALLRGYL
jgi:hypothetical protein